MPTCSAKAALLHPVPGKGNVFEGGRDFDYCVLPDVFSYDFGDKYGVRYRFNKVAYHVDEIEPLKRLRQVTQDAALLRLQKINQEMQLQKNRVFIQHHQFERLLGHIELAASCLGGDDQAKALRVTMLSSQLAANLRVLHSQISKFNELKSSGLSSVESLSKLAAAAGPAAFLEPTTAVICISISIFALLASTENAAPVPLSHEVFFRALNDGLMPAIRDLQVQVGESRQAQAESLDEKSSQLAMIFCTGLEGLQADINKWTRKIDLHLDDQDHTTHVKYSQERLTRYLESINDIGRFISSSEMTMPLSSLDKYLDDSQTLLREASEKLAHGFKGEKPCYSLEASLSCPIFSLGLLHAHTGAEGTMPQHLPFVHSIGHSLSALVHKLCKRSGFITRDREARLFNLAKDLRGALEGSRKRMDETGPFLLTLLKSHQSFMERLRLNMTHVISIVEATPQEELVGSKMFYWNRLVKRNLELPETDKSIYTEFQSCSVLEAIPVLLIGPLVCVGYGVELLARGQWGRSEDHKSHIQMQHQSLSGKSTAELFQASPALTPFVHTAVNKLLIKRDIYWNGMEFQTGISIDASCKRPTSGFFQEGTWDEVKAAPSRPQKPDLAFEAVWSSAGTCFIFTMAADSRLKKEDVGKVQAIPNQSLSQRGELMQSAVAAINGAEDKVESKLLQECTNIAHVGKSPTPLPLKDSTLESLLQLEFPDYNRMKLAGVSLDTSYQLELRADGDYHIRLFYSYNGQLMQKRTVIRVDRQTVEAFKKPGGTPQMQEFLYTFLFNEFYAGDGMPDSRSHSTAEGVFAPHLSQIPSPIRILEKFPNLTFRVSWRNLTASSISALEASLRSGKIKPGAECFFVDPTRELELGAYMSLRKQIASRISALEESAAYKQLKDAYTLALVQCTLVSDFSVREVRCLLARYLNVLPPGEFGSFEQAHDYQAPSQKKMDELLYRLSEKPSPARANLSLLLQNITAISENAGALNNFGTSKLAKEMQIYKLTDPNFLLEQAS